MYLDYSNPNSIQLNYLKDKQLKFYMAYEKYRNTFLNVKQNYPLFNEEEKQYYDINFENDWKDGSMLTNIAKEFICRSSDNLEQTKN